METTTRSWTLAELAQLLGGTLTGPPDKRILRPVPSGSPDPDGITFAESAEYLNKAKGTAVGAVIVPRGSMPMDIPTIQVDRPREAFGRILAMCNRALPIAAGIHPLSVVSPSAEIAASASIGAFAVVEANARIGENSKIYSFAYIGENCKLGADVVVYPNAVLYQDVEIGDRSIIHAGAVIAADGFGYVWDSPKRNHRVKVPQVGRVVIGADVEIGANSSIDRATAGTTVVEDGAKIDNLVQVGHNSKIGGHTAIAGLVAIGGSSNIGRRNEIGGQTAISDHLTTGDDVAFAGRTGVTNDVLKPGVYWGLPAQPIIGAHRVQGLTNKLPELYKRVKELEARLAELEKKTS